MEGKGRKETLPSLPSFSVYFPSAMTSEREGDQEGGRDGGGLLQHHSACSEAITAFSEEDLCGRHIAGAAPLPSFPVVSAASPWTYF